MTMIKTMFCDDDGDGFSVNNYGNSDRHEDEKVEEKPQKIYIFSDRNWPEPD